MKLYRIDTGESEKELLYKVSCGDEVAFRIIFDRYRKRIYSYALKIIKSGTQAEDILHDVLLKIWQHKNLSEIDNLEAYLKIVTRNHTLKILKRHQLEIRTNQARGADWHESDNETEETILFHDTKKILLQGIGLLPPQQKKVYHLCREEGLKYEEAAKRLSISPLTAKTHMQHALRFLRNYLSKNTDVSKIVILLHFVSENRWLFNYQV